MNVRLGDVGEDETPEGLSASMAQELSACALEGRWDVGCLRWNLVRVNRRRYYEHLYLHIQANEAVVRNDTERIEESREECWTAAEMGRYHASTGTPPLDLVSRRTVGC